jgi:hypothetical protein
MSEEPKKIPSGTGTGFGAVNEKTVSKEGSQASHDKDRRSSSSSSSSSSLAGSNQEDNKQKDIVLEVLRRLPERWDRSKNAMELLMIADSQDAAWVAKRIFQDIDRGLIKANFMVKRSKYSSCEMIVNIESIANVANNTYSTAGVIITALKVLLRDIKFGTILRRSKKKL